jgi:hypothetical protein
MHTTSLYPLYLHRHFAADLRPTYAVYATNGDEHSTYVAFSFQRVLMFLLLPKKLRAHVYMIAISLEVTYHSQFLACLVLVCFMCSTTQVLQCFQIL